MIENSDEKYTYIVFVKMVVEISLKQNASQKKEPLSEETRKKIIQERIDLLKRHSELHPLTDEWYQKLVAERNPERLK